MKKVIIVHGWDGSPDEGWFPWIKEELKKQKAHVQIPAMPSPEHPKISPWVNKLQEIVGSVDKDTYFVGHSVGCQAILRFLETLPEGTKAGKVILVAPWTKLTDEALADEESLEIANPWMTTEIDWANVRGKALEFIAFFSKTDPYVAVSEQEIFKRELDAEVILVSGPGHLGGEDEVEELLEILEYLT